jgi:hypothetical protein
MVNPTAASATTAATTITMMKVVLLRPAIFSGSLLAAAAEADAEAEAVTRTTVELRDTVRTVVCVERAIDDGLGEASSEVGEASASATTGSAEVGEG